MRSQADADELILSASETFEVGGVVARLAPSPRLDECTRAHDVSC